MRNPTAKTVIATLKHAIRDVLPDHFERRRRFGPEAVLLTLLTHLFDHKRFGYEGLLARTARLFGRHLGWGRPPSPSNFTRARAKVDNDLLLQAYGRLAQRFAGCRRAPGGHLGGKRAVAIDACYINMPATKELRDDFGRRRTQVGECYNAHAQLVVLWDIWAQVPITWICLPCDWHERDAAQDLLCCLDQNDILIGDRAYPSRDLLKRLTDRGISYIFRLSTEGTSVWREARRALRQARRRGSDQKHQIRSKTWGKCATYPARLIKTRKPGRRQAKKGHRERMLVTNLPDNQVFTQKVIQHLYCMRWHIEVAFREMKTTYCLERFSGKSLQAIEQEIIAFMVLWLLKGQISQVALWRRWHSQDADRQRYPHRKIKRTCILEVVIEAMRATYDRSATGPAEAHLEQWLKWLDGKYYTIRDGRSHPRIRKSRLPGWHNHWRNYYGFMAA
jgi:hypothetical protein